MQEITFERLRDMLLQLVDGVDQETKLVALATVLAIEMADANAPTLALEFRSKARISIKLEAI